MTAGEVDIKMLTIRLSQLRFIAYVCCSLLQHVVACCNVLQCVAEYKFAKTLSVAAGAVNMKLLTI